MHAIHTYNAASLFIKLNQGNIRQGGYKSARRRVEKMPHSYLQCLKLKSSPVCAYANIP